MMMSNVKFYQRTQKLKKSNTKLLLSLQYLQELDLENLWDLNGVILIFETELLALTRQVNTYQKKVFFTKDPKTESSVRDVAIPSFVLSLLEEYKLWYEEQKLFYGELWTNSNRLFVQADGKPMHPNTISKWFVKFVEKIGLPVINFHGLRHTNATLLISQNIDIAVVAARLGHAQITTTLNFYVHPVISHNKVAGNVLENLLISQKSLKMNN